MILNNFTPDKATMNAKLCVCIANSVRNKDLCLVQVKNNKIFKRHCAITQQSIKNCQGKHRGDDYIAKVLCYWDPMKFSFLSTNHHEEIQSKETLEKL